MYKNACKRRNIKRYGIEKNIYNFVVVTFNTLNAEMIKPSKDLSAFDWLKFN